MDAPYLSGEGRLEERHAPFSCLSFVHPAAQSPPVAANVAHLHFWGVDMKTPCPSIRTAQKYFGFFAVFAKLAACLSVSTGRCEKVRWMKDSGGKADQTNRCDQLPSVRTFANVRGAGRPRNPTAGSMATHQRGPRRARLTRLALVGPILSRRPPANPFLTGNLKLNRVLCT